MISDQWIVTAAHCLENTNELNVCLGTSNVDDPFGIRRSNYRLGKDAIHIYPGYSSTYAWNDIGMRLKYFSTVDIAQFGL